jgi:hypothetical protein
MGQLPEELQQQELTSVLIKHSNGEMTIYQKDIDGDWVPAEQFDPDEEEEALQTYEYYLAGAYDGMLSIGDDPSGKGDVMHIVRELIRQMIFQYDIMYTDAIEVIEECLEHLYHFPGDLDAL